MPILSFTFTPDLNAGKLTLKTFFNFRISFILSLMLLITVLFDNILINIFDVKISVNYYLISFVFRFICFLFITFLLILSGNIQNKIKREIKIFEDRIEILKIKSEITTIFTWNSILNFQLEKDDVFITLKDGGSATISLKDLDRETKTQFLEILKSKTNFGKKGMI